jgi:ferritin-like metal-binding protein YciE
MKATTTNKKQTATPKASATKTGKSSEKQNNHHSELHDLFVDGLKDLYWAEKALTKALPKLAKKAFSPALIEGLTSHLEETKGQVERLEQVFQSINEKASAKKCEAMEGLIKEGDEIVEEFEKGQTRDAGIIMACQKVEHYEIASYGTLKAFGKLLGYTDAVTLLDETLTEEKSADESLTDITPEVLSMEQVAQ